MNKLIQTEIYKSIHNKYFAISMITAFIIQLFNVYPYYVFKNEALAFDLEQINKGIATLIISRRGKHRIALWKAPFCFTESTRAQRGKH